MLPIEPAGFKPGRDATEQVLALTSFVEAGFKKRLKTGTVLFDLSALVFHCMVQWTIAQIIKIIKCKKCMKLLKRMAGPKNFTVLRGSDLSNTRTIKNGFPQG